MDKSEYQARFMSLPPVEAKRLTNTVAYINEFHPVGDELRSLLRSLTPAAKLLLLDMLQDRFPDST
jgi:hypothetical protein